MEHSAYTQAVVHLTLATDACNLADVTLPPALSAPGMADVWYIGQYTTASSLQILVTK